MKYPVKRQISSGGVIFRKKDKEIQIALIQPKENIWCLPKGIVEKGEDPGETAFREVREETGLTGELVNKIGEINYWYASKEDKARYFKTVHFYLFCYQSGNISDHDWEIENVAWINIEEAIKIMSYPNEKEIVEKAKTLITADKKS